MRDKKAVVARLRRLRAVNVFGGRAEVNNLYRVLRSDELIEYAVCGAYESSLGKKGYGMLVCTNERMLFVDKIFTHLFMEDVPYDMIAEVHYGSSPLNGILTVVARTKQVTFKSIKQARLSYMARLIEQKIQDYHLSRQVAFNGPATPYPTMDSNQLPIP